MSKRLFLEVDTSQIDIKKILKKDFLELSMRAISSANPNRNNSWFTKESMERSLDSFVNKPILGYFENGDFVSHDGEWEYDPETEMSYWDTLGKKGERILGTIRESDEIKIVEDENGLSWIVFSCILWTQYCFKQVKRLLKDAKRAQKNGGSTKNISVEVDITDYEMLENGVMKINEFKLVGVTILGSRNHVKVEPGIEDAELSVTDIMGHDVYNKQTQALRLAYEKLDKSAEDKEEVILENEKITEPSVEEKPIEEPKKEEFEGAEATTEEVKTETLEQDPKVQDPIDAEHSEIKDPVEEHFEDGSQTEEGTTEKDPVQESTEETHDSNTEEKTEEESHDEHFEENPQPDPIHDLAWLISECAWNVESMQNVIKYYEDSENPYKEYIIAVLSRIIRRQQESEKELGELLSKVTTDSISDEDKEEEELYEKYEDVSSLIHNYENVIKEHAELQTKYDTLEAENNKNIESIKEYEHKEYIKAANELIDSANIQDETVIAKFKAECEDNTISSLEDLKVKVAVYTFDNNVEHTSNSLNVPVAKPNVDAAFDKKHTKKVTSNHWDALHAYIHDED